MSSENKDHISVMMLVASLPPLPAGGAEMQALRLGEALIKKGLTVSFITPGKGSVKGETNILGMPVYRLHSWLSSCFDYLSGRVKKNNVPSSKIEYDDKTELTDQINSKVGWPTVVYYNLFYINAFLFLWPRRKSFDIVHAHTMEWSAIVATRLGKALKKPVLIKDSTMNGFDSLSRFPSGARMQGMVIKSAFFVAMTRVIRENLLKAGISGNRIRTIPNGISMPDHHQVFKKWGDPPSVLFVGNLYQQPAKGVDILLRAWSIVHRRLPNAQLLIVGDGTTQGYSDFAERLEISKSVRFLGKQSDLDSYFTSADAFVLPSRREGMSNALIEAMKHGLPCVATDISGNQDLIEDGINGYLVPPKDEKSLAAGILKVLEDPQKAMELGNEAKRTIRQRAEIGVVADQYISYYKQILGTEPPNTR